MHEFTYLVTVRTDTQAHADQVIAERLGHDEDYGFTYTVDHDSFEGVAENLSDALSNLERAHATIEVEFGRLTGISPELDNVSHHIQETFTALGLNQPRLEE